MTRLSELSSRYLLGCGLALSLFTPLAGASAQETTLYTFTGGNDGGNPPCGLIYGGKGLSHSTKRFYGAAEDGGTSDYGTVFEIDNPGSETVLHSFTGSDGAYPVSCLIMDASGNLYGTTEQGGGGVGVVFKVTPGGTETVLHSFAGGSDGEFPEAGLIMDSSGNLYGTTSNGGTSDFGVVFKIAPGGAETVLHSFTGGSDGKFPDTSLIMDSSGNLYGVTINGGANNLGVVFKVTTGGVETVLHTFAGSDGAYPAGSLIINNGQNLYGTTEEGGSSNLGIVFELSHKGKETVLYSFIGGSDGETPIAGLIKKSGYFYGTTTAGGANNSGTVFKLPDKGGSDTVLYSFTGGSDGSYPQGGVIDEGGNLFGTTLSGGDAGCFFGDSCGVIFELTP
jgi:uncharacterized repeat protein (TIGR03803 family)